MQLGVSMRYIYLWVDRFTDRIFSRKRHEDERALRQFAHEAAYITDHTVLLARALRTVEEHTTAVDAAILTHPTNPRRRSRSRVVSACRSTSLCPNIEAIRVR